MPNQGEPSSRAYVANLKDGDHVFEVYLCTRKALPVDRTSRRYLHMTLSDRTGDVEALLWEEAERRAERFAQHDLVRVTGTVVSFQGRRQLHLTEIQRADSSEVAAAEVVRRGPEDPQRLWAELRALLATVQDPHLAQLWRLYVDDADLMAALLAAPAAKSIHHAYLGGLLEHTLSVVRLVDLIYAHYHATAPHLLNRDLCVVGAFLHDLGKIEEISTDPGFQYTDVGRLLGHIVLGQRLLERKLAQLAAQRDPAAPAFPEELADHLRHILVAHHGELDRGSPKRPQTAESLLVHHADELDSRVISLRDLLALSPAQGWTPYQPLYDRYFWQGWPSGER
jgi:3'-5' exoribonuclease